MSSAGSEANFNQIGFVKHDLMGVSVRPERTYSYATHCTYVDVASGGALFVPASGEKKIIFVKTTPDVTLVLTATDCQCGTDDSTASTGRYCVVSSNDISPRPPVVCEVTDGSTSNPPGVDCRCGSNDCTDDNGRYCVASTNSCSTRPPATCSVTNGKTASSDAFDCQCGTVDCPVSSVMYCLASSNRCSTRPPLT